MVNGHKAFRPRNIPCLVPGCPRYFKNKSGRTQHENANHIPFHRRQSREPSPPDSPVPPGSHIFRNIDPPAPKRQTIYHPKLNGRPCDRDGNFLPPNTPPPAKEHPASDDYSPYESQLDFHLADLLYRKMQLSAGEIDELMQNWAARPQSEGDPPFADHEDLYATIDSTAIGHVPWQSFEVMYDKPLAPGETTPWKTRAYTVHFRDPRLVLRNQLANPDFKFEMDFAPKRVFAADGSREYEDLMSRNWAWRQADIIIQDPATHGSTYVPIILGSDKTTVSVATVQNEYYPLYMSNGLVHNNVRRAHRNAVTLIGFLAIPKRRIPHVSSQPLPRIAASLFHGSLRHILESLRPAMTVPEVALFADGHHRRVIYGLGPYIADYPEQVLLTCTVQGWCSRCTASNKNLDGESGRRSQRHTEALFDAFDHKTLWDDYGVIPDVLPFTWTFPRADIHELISPDLLHQVIKGTFKDHLVAWVGEYLESVHGASKAKKIMADIDRRIAAIPPFPGLRRFPEGRGFKQWTGDNSKALMKVCLAPSYFRSCSGPDVACLQRLPRFLLLVRRNIVGEATLVAIDAALARYHLERQIFEENGVCPNGFCLPRQHSLTHYRYLIQEFGAPNGLCSSITESKHIKAVKEPWRRSSRYEALLQMLTINDRLDKLAAARVDFVERGMLSGPAARPGDLPLPPVAEEEDDDIGATDQRDILGEVMLAKTPLRNYPRSPYGLAERLSLPKLPNLLRRFLYAQEHPELDVPLAEILLEDSPDAPRSVKVFPSAVATFYAPSDQSGIGGLLRERIRAVRSWRGGPARYDCVYVEQDAEQPGFRGLLAARVLLFMSFKHGGVEYPCALVTWFSTYGDEPCPNVGMWMFRSFYINKYADHHSHGIAF
ncbi:hypothetical protein C8R43DRAFT_1091601 [Mycena crocata]|nr:hypothetical protein C8R43DRAFT_1091601 [Mycena crocata]